MSHLQGYGKGMSHPHAPGHALIAIREDRGSGSSLPSCLADVSAEVPCTNLQVLMPNAKMEHADPWEAREREGTQCHNSNPNTSQPHDLAWEY